MSSGDVNVFPATEEVTSPSELTRHVERIADTLERIEAKLFHAQKDPVEALTDELLRREREDGGDDTGGLDSEHW